jgi:flagellar assembly protein FliH
MPSSSRIVFAEDLADVSPWMPGEIAGERRAGADRRVSPGRRAEDAAETKGPTYEEGLRDGYARGVEEGRAEARAELDARIAAVARRGDEIAAAFTAQLAAVQQSMADELVSLAVEIARSAFGAALRVRDDAVVPAVTAALAAIVDEHARPVVHLHPDDAALVGEQLAPALAARGVQLVSDDAIEPGGCRVETARASVDATVRTRWRRALAALGRDDDWVQA